ncbi:Undecaprenyl-phosphate galactose phosphotransferase WbaP/exopolysaccharide biosynthesis polyprenyl glycosylphosphotransferase [Rhodococcus sp. SMB37]|uniref:sugar transferase n=1 Tax=Rhodococcus sp. SMB37 TaxID=2512213 RepID=UPI00104E9BFD|nr:sugar transferase [Rhodococcus sp. SMB37]TCN49155.1 Undecaprenyl-phosphate galactose phosphotransferase WbaP/exopolysaccharide biosynthesis polyprenyl glycosylphosphotransferase [Rhodococcus sp. SMB37]
MSRGGDNDEGWCAVTAVGEKRNPATEDGVVSFEAKGVVGRSDASGTRWAWQTSYGRHLFWTDTVIVVLAVLLAHIVRFGHENLLTMDPVSTLNYTLISAGLAVAWMVNLRLFRTRSRRVIGAGYDEYQRVVSSTLRLFGFIAILALVFQVELARGYLAIALPVGLLGLLLSRWVWRKVVAQKRRRGEYTTSVLVVGGARAVRHLSSTFERKFTDGYRVVGVCVPAYSGSVGDEIDVDGRPVPILGDEHSIIKSLSASGADTVAVAATETLGPEGIKDLVWQLDPLDADLVVATGVVDVAGPRLEMRPVAGLPLIHVEKPSYHGAKRSGKRVFDLVFSALALVALAPVFAVVAVLIKLDNKGPVFYKAERIGLDGEPFGMIKFRSMVTKADAMVESLLVQNEGAGVLFKMRDDPRVTRVGKVLRRYSIDELPQFINVLRGEMSVVGPRPPLRREVENYDGRVKRRLLVRPGVTGLWQVSGRSDLSWDESVRLDLSYVENWSMISDVLIIGKTVKAVVASDGAY